MSPASPVWEVENETTLMSRLDGWGATRSLLTCTDVYGFIPPTSTTNASCQTARTHLSGEVLDMENEVISNQMQLAKVCKYDIYIYNYIQVGKMI